MAAVLALVLWTLSALTLRWTRPEAAHNLPASIATGMNAQSVTVYGHEIGLPMLIHVSRDLNCSSS